MSLGASREGRQGFREGRSETRPSWRTWSAMTLERGSHVTPKGVWYQRSPSQKRWMRVIASISSALELA